MHIMPPDHLVYMAEGNYAWVQKLNKELKCPVYQEHFEEPKVLSCQCMADLISHAHKGITFSCSECH